MSYPVDTGTGARWMPHAKRERASRERPRRMGGRDEDEAEATGVGHGT